jgi:hypothetical protein
MLNAISKRPLQIPLIQPPTLALIGSPQETESNNLPFRLVGAIVAA